MAVPRVLNVAEKPSVAKAVAGILSRNQVHVREGRSPYNKIFEFSYSLSGQQCLMLMTSVTGHLMEVDFEDQYRKWHSCDPAVLYQAPIRKRVPQDKLALQRTLQEEARRCQRLVLWLDCDREGENIAYEVMEVCQGSNPRLDIWRAHFSALIERDIHHAAQHLGRPNRMFSDAVDARQEIDLRIGASFTRFQTMLLKDSFVLPYAGEERNMVLSYGPCQFPTLGFVVERYWQIQAHVPEEFWTINCSYSSNEGSCQFVWMRGRLFDHVAASVIYEMCMEDSTATVIQVTGQETRKFPPCPLNTVELQKRCSRNFRMSSEQTMKVSEELYQSGFISYPRTETDSFTENTDLQKREEDEITTDLQPPANGRAVLIPHGMVREQTGHRTWGAYAQRLLDPAANLWRQPSNGGHNDKAHPPIHPTRFSEGESNWTNDHRRVYELVVRHFLACVSQPAIGYKSTASIDIAGETFTATGLMITAKNYLEVYIYESWGTSTLPTFEIGQQFVPDSLSLDSGTTQPPPLLSEADLISLMDKAGIGTDATMHDHIKKLLDRCYATKDANTRFSPTNLGEALVMGYDSMGYELWKPYLRSMMENDMKAVSEGTKSKDQVLASCLQQMNDCFLDARQKKEKLFEAMELFFERAQGGRTQGDDQVGEVVRLCPTCQLSNMRLKKRQDGNYFVSCSGYPLCRTVVWLPGAISEASVQSQACEVCGPGQVFKIRFKFRRAEIPPQYSTDYTGCVGGCDNILKEIIEMCGTGSRPPTAVSAQNVMRAGRSGGANASVNQQRSGQRISTEYPNAGRSGRACSSCGQLGHYSTDCPGGHGRGATTGWQSGSTVTGSNEDIRCSCNEKCLLRTANTEANRGRQFYGCPSRTCSFFLWEDAGQSSGRLPQSTILHRSNSLSGSTNTRGQSGPGGSRANGSRGRGRTTNHATARSGQTTSRGGRGQSSGRGNQGNASSDRGNCFICGDSSHWSNACPSRN